MKNFTFLSLIVIIISAISAPIAIGQSTGTTTTTELYNTRRNFVTINGATGGGDYPFAALGLNIGRHFFEGNMLAGVGFQYIGTTDDGSGIGGTDQAQLFTLMLDLRYKFMESSNGRFSTFLIGAGGYAIPINDRDEDSDGIYEDLNGWVINAGIGFRFNVFQNMGLMADATWLHHAGQRVWEPPSTKRIHMKWDLVLFRGHIFF
jgi:hypothetical protein